MTSLKLRVIACAAAAVALCSIGGTAFAATGHTERPRTVASSQQLQRVEVGTKIEIVNGSAERLYVKASDRSSLDRGDRMEFAGNNPDLDVSSKLGRDKNKMITIAGHNSLMSSAYLQLGDTQFTEGRIVNIEGMEFQITYDGREGQFPSKEYKKWTLTYRGQSPFQHHWVHHTDKLDGTKGYIINESGKDVIVHTGGHDIFLKKDQRLIYFDAHDFSSGAGSKFWISQPGNTTGKRLATVTVMDPSIGTPAALVERDSGKSTHYYSEGDSQSYTDPSTGATLTVKRHHDATLPVLWENSSTNDWALFDITIR